MASAAVPSFVEAPIRLRTCALEYASGLNAEGENAEGENADGLNAEGENADGENADGLNADGENADGENADGADAAPAYSALKRSRSSSVDTGLNASLMSLKTNMS